MLMKLQNMNHLGKEWGYDGCFTFTPSSCVVISWREKPNHTQNLRQILLVSNKVWVQGFCGEFNPKDLSWVSPRWETKPWAPWRCLSSPGPIGQPLGGAQSQGQGGPPTLTRRCGRPVAFGLKELSLWSLVRPSNKDHCSIAHLED